MIPIHITNCRPKCRCCHSCTKKRITLHLTLLKSCRRLTDDRNTQSVARAAVLIFLSRKVERHLKQKETEKTDKDRNIWHRERKREIDKERSFDITHFTLSVSHAKFETATTENRLIKQRFVKKYTCRLVTKTKICLNLAN